MLKFDSKRTLEYNNYLMVGKSQVHDSILTEVHGNRKSGKCKNKRVVTGTFIHGKTGFCLY